MEKALKLREQVKARTKAIEDLVAAENDEIHTLVGKFSEAHGGSIGGATLRQQDYSTYSRDFASGQQPAAEKVAVAEQKLPAVWAWLNRVTASSRLARITDTKIAFRRGAGGHHDKAAGEIEIGVEPTSFESTAVHEYGHFIEDNNSDDTMWALAEDYWKRVDRLRSQSQEFQFFKHSDADFYSAPAPTKLKLSEWGSSVLGYDRRYSDFAYSGSYSYRSGSFVKQGPARNAGGTEVFSTGIQALHKNAAEFRKKTRSHFDLTMLVLAGVL
jgi:hypothetical protein